MEDYVASLEKGDLHVHLNGLASTEVLRSQLREVNDGPLEDFDLECDLTSVMSRLT